MMNKHVFGYLVQCANCKQPVMIVYAHTWEQANAGQGICEPCTEIANEHQLDRANESDQRLPGSATEEIAEEHKPGNV